MFRRLAFVLTLGAMGVLALPGSALADEHITTYGVTLTVATDGSFHVREELGYDFGTEQRHGILRSIPVRYTFDATQDRLVDIDEVTVSSPTGAPTNLTTSVDGGTLTLKVGDPSRTVSGLQQYVLDYEVRGAMNAFNDHAEVFWNAIGPQWSAAISGVQVTVRGPAPPTKVACYAGPDGSGLPCSSATIAGDQAVFTQDQLDPYQGLTVAVALPVGAVRVPAPMLAERFSVTRAFEGTPWTISGAAVVLATGLAGVGFLVWSRGRDRRWRAEIPGLEPPAKTHEDESTTQALPLFADRSSAVEFAPPRDVRPGQVGTLLDEQVNPLDVTASIVDLAVRGFLHIEELPREHVFSSRDWRLSKLTAADSTLRPYEKTLLRELFAGRTQVLVSELKRTFAGSLAAVRNALYDDVVAAGWFRARPDTTRSRWAAVGGLCVALGCLADVRSRPAHPCGTARGGCSPVRSGIDGAGAADAGPDG